MQLLLRPFGIILIIINIMANQIINISNSDQSDR